MPNSEATEWYHQKVNNLFLEKILQIFYTQV